MFLEDLSNAAVEKCGLRQAQPILIGVSGGADSLALLYGLKSLEFNLVIAHVDHALRSESVQEANFVQQVAESFGLPFYSQRIDVGKAAQVQGQSIEEAARVVRYQYLFEQARLHECQAVAVAHHADDQVETVLMHFLRGSALPGLTGMAYRRLMPQWDPDIPLVRPLLGIWRYEIEAYVEGVGLKPCIDLSNLDTTYYRNRIRHELIPALETFNPQIKAAIWRMANVLHEEARYLDALTEHAFEEGLREKNEQRIIFDLTKFLNLPIALKRRILRQAIAQLQPDLRDIGFDAIARGLSFIEGGQAGGDIDLVSCLNLAVIEDKLVIKTWDAELPDLGQALLPDEEFKAILSLNAPLNLRNHWRIEASLLEAFDDKPINLVKNLTPDQAWLDYDCLDLPLVVRGRKSGERYHPLGMGGQSQGLQDFFVNLKIPEHLRSLWPLVISGQRVAWVVGLRPSEDFKVTQKTERVLNLKLIKSKP